MANKSYQKRCKKCKSEDIIKDGFKRGKQRYKCKSCRHVFQNKAKKQKININELWYKYCFRKQTYAELAEDYGVTIKTIQKYLDKYEIETSNIVPTEVILLIDTTYFGDFGIMVFKDANRNKIINLKVVNNENNYDYKKGIEELKEQGWIIKAIVCDGRRGLLTGFPGIPTQMCNFHQVAIVRRYITKNPILEANKTLKQLSELLVRTDKETFSYYLDLYGEIYKDFLNEKALGSNGRMNFVHKKTKTAYKSLKNNLKYLFTWYDYYGIIDIPNTTNGLEGIFGHIKAKVSLHRGLKKERKIKLILSLLYGKI